MRLLVFLLGFAVAVVSARGACRPYEAFAYEGRVVSCRALTDDDLPASPRYDAEGARRALAAEPMVVLELELTRERRVALCEDVEACVPSARAWRTTRGKRRLLAFGQPSDWESRIDLQAAYFAPLPCCELRPSVRPSCALTLPVIQRTPADLVAFVHDGREGSIARNEPPRDARPESPPPENEADAASAAPGGADGESRFDRARALYALGPDHAEEILELLGRELESHPENESARRLLAITLFGTRRFEAALAEFDAILSESDSRDTEHPRLQLLRARALEALGRRDEARAALEAHWAFFLMEEDTAAQAEELAARLTLHSPLFEASDLVFLNAALRSLPPSSRSSLVGAVAIVVRSPEFLHLQHDVDLAPAIVSARLSGDEVLVLVARRTRSEVVFFRNGLPTAYSADGGPHREPPPTSAADDAPRVTLTAGTLTADDGTPLAAYEIGAPRSATPD